ncbi:hypothetical protein AOLI_G00175030 [Acnodon oligacanthus]
MCGLCRSPPSPQQWCSPRTVPLGRSQPGTLMPHRVAERRGDGLHGKKRECRRTARDAPELKTSETEDNLRL